MKVYWKSFLITKRVLSGNLYAFVGKSMGRDVKVACTNGAIKISRKGNLVQGGAMTQSIKMIKKWVSIGRWELLEEGTVLLSTDGSVVGDKGGYGGLSIGHIEVLYDDAWYVLSNARQFFPNIDFSHIKSGNASISHLRTYLTITADRDDDITIARTFILFMMGHLWFQMANDTVLLGYFVAVADLDEAAQYDWGSAIHAFLYHSLDTAVTTGGASLDFPNFLSIGSTSIVGLVNL
ncbi:hypothetical protein GIB67_017477 [Kingdonia uniflora]|uniref:Aminotransferase-like plant mobile domain-containing protein n=1 Tax=Kingdonia uniflora TaxID=39325 RepID=A0A7J7M4P6_9MAGN|nr:hypothetical protein GIB67_017477 [Kingdonia uniflora]